MGARKVLVKPKTPFYVLERDGVTQGLMAKFLTCRQLTRYFLDGWSLPNESFALSFGSIVHECLDIYYTHIKANKSEPNIDRILKMCEVRWEEQNPHANEVQLEQKEIAMAMAEAVVPNYIEHWRKEDAKILWDKIEEEFAYPVEVSGVEFPVRGKFDATFRLKKKLWLFETKTKSFIQEGKITDMLSLDLQVGTYLNILKFMEDDDPVGVRYNIIRRPNLRQGAKESLKDFAKRCADDVKKRPNHYFIRLEMVFSKKDLDMYWKDIIVPILKDYVAWYQGKLPHYRNMTQCETKYGSCTFLPVCSRYSRPEDEIGYKKRKRVFMELT